jgi:nucleotide-binding universal stress UspA family protein
VRKILTVLDGSDEAEEALEAARRVAAEGTELVLASVVPSFRTIPSHDVVLLTDLAAAAGQAHEYLHQVAARISDLRVSTVVRVSPLSAAEIWAELMLLASEEGCDLIAMTTSPGMVSTINVLLKHGPTLLLVPGRAAPVQAGKAARVPRSPVPRLGLAFESVFSSRREEGLPLWGLPAGSEAR